METVLASYAFTSNTWSDLGRTCLGDGNLLQAGSCYRAALDRTPDDPLLWASLAHCQNELGLLAQAAKSLRHALSLAPHYDEARMSLVQVLIRQGKQVDAFRVLWEAKKQGYRIR